MASASAQDIEPIVNNPNAKLRLVWDADSVPYTDQIMLAVLGETGDAQVSSDNPPRCITAADHLFQSLQNVSTAGMPVTDRRYHFLCGHTSAELLVHSHGVRPSLVFMPVSPGTLSASF